MTPWRKTVLLLGATSDIGRATALCYGAAGWRVILAARDVGAAERNAGDIRTRTGAEVEVIDFEAMATAMVTKFVDSLPVLPDTVVCVVGELGEQTRAQEDPDHASRIIRTNFEGPALMLDTLAGRFAARGSGTIVGVSSVAGDRGRGSNYFYGAAKAGFSGFLSGLRNRLARAGGVHVLTVKPGFVRTRMTAGMNLPAALTAEPDAVGRAIYRAAEERRRNVIYVKPVWRPIMAMIRALPEPIFKRLGL